ncbi:MAG: Uma2 family endonuclease [Burkholderiales bacterium]
MGRVADLRFVSPEAYLDWEARQPDKNEYLRGEVYAMTGASQAHVMVNGNLFVALSRHLRGTGCRAYLPDLKLRIAAVDAFFYPDLKVSCDERDLKADYAIEHPIVLAEVLSASTADYDRGTKLTAYLTLASLREYLLVDPDSRSVQLYRRNPDSTWVLVDYSGTTELRLESLDFVLPLAELFDGL